jgi:DNA-binding transcriptional regulator YiaG
MCDTHGLVKLIIRKKRAKRTFMETHLIDIRLIRQNLGWTQDQLADYLGLNRSSVSKLETGVHVARGPTLKMLERLMKQAKIRA